MDRVPTARDAANRRLFRLGHQRLIYTMTLFYRMNCQIKTIQNMGRYVYDPGHIIPIVVLFSGKVQFP